ncbi:hypothetical protein HPB51_004300 [Rhipicephalus microplus]|uniref:AP-3 complex subunit delta Mu C-terminal domain-containing protein n=1 Tax=Rhipicephalus microplus TaxID=6941 RepID=A0A9J6EKM8_RHIMP|nr:hypothetical protein HPB51_004300 [Rhipicephalus microplus]
MPSLKLPNRTPAMAICGSTSSTPTWESRDTFAELLSGGELSAKGSITLEAIEYEFPHVLSKVCFHCHFTVVEQVGLSASLYSRSIQDDHICLLIKHMV